MKGKKAIRASFRKAVFIRDGYRCRVCGRQWATGDGEPALHRVDAHHITDRSKMPGGGYVVENGITVCQQPCHPRVERFHASGETVWEAGLHPVDLYDRVGVTYDTAYRASQALVERPTPALDRSRITRIEAMDRAILEDYIDAQRRLYPDSGTTLVWSRPLERRASWRER